MIALLQRVKSAAVSIGGECVGKIDEGLLVFLGVEKNDSQALADKLLSRVLSYRVFADDEGKMNNSVKDHKGGLLIVSQFTLAADTRKGLRPGFSRAADPVTGEALYNYFLSQAKDLHSPVASGRFGGDMQVSLVNDGPVTFWLQSND